jgi:Na+-translocating ferredoxin:NAD+ oxidoreductase RNF subunit RnfB
MLNRVSNDWKLFQGLEKQLFMKTGDLIDKSICTGCGACAASCADNCISMAADEEAFPLSEGVSVVPLHDAMKAVAAS